METMRLFNFCPHHHQYPHHHYYNHQERQHHHNHHHQDAHLYVKVHPLLVGLDNVAPVEKVVVVHHSAREVGLAQHLKMNLNVFLAA